MSKTRAGLAALIFVFITGEVFAGNLTPFRGRWDGRTIEATPLTENAVFVLSRGEGVASSIGKFQMDAPHVSYLDTFVVEGSHIFIAKNGDQLVADFAGTFTPRPDGCLEGTFPSTFTGNGTGRFAGASGGYDFHIVACPSPTGFGFDSTATFDGGIALVKGK